MSIRQWWEVWWKKPGSKPVRMNSGWPASESGAPAGTFDTLLLAKEFKEAQKNKYCKVVHVTRFKTRKSYCWYRERADGSIVDWWHGHDYVAEGLSPYWHPRGDNATKYRTKAEAMKYKPTGEGHEVKLHTYSVKVKEKTR